MQVTMLMPITFDEEGNIWGIDPGGDEERIPVSDAQDESDPNDLNQLIIKKPYTMGYKEAYFREAIGDAFENANAYEAWRGLTNLQKDGIVKSILVWVDCQDMAFGHVDTGGESQEAKDLKAQIASLKKEAEEWELAFKNNVSTRRGWSMNETYVSKDGSAGRRD